MSSKRKHRRNPSQTTQPAPTAPIPIAPAPRGKKLMFTVAAVLVIGFVVVAFSLPGTSSGGLTASARPEHGKQLYGQYCAACHGSQGQGEFQWQYRERGAPALDSSGHAWHHEDAQLLSMILDKPMPDSRMPAWRDVLSRDDTVDLLAYMKSLWTPYILANCQGAKHMNCTNTH